MLVVGKPVSLLAACGHCAEEHVVSRAHAFEATSGDRNTFGITALHSSRMELESKGALHELKTC